jgi:hypothetical protein
LQQAPLVVALLRPRVGKVHVHAVGAGGIMSRGFGRVMLDAIIGQSEFRHALEKLPTLGP